MRTWLRSVCGGVFLIGAAISLAGCQSLPTGPSLTDFEVTNIAGQPTTGNPGLCCCHVIGTATNHNAVPLHATIQFSGFNAQGGEISKILYFIQDLPPGGSHSIDAPGFIVPCNAISRYSWEVKVRGITYPPL
jgi:hypothetical protein